MPASVGGLFAMSNGPSSNTPRRPRPGRIQSGRQRRDSFAEAGRHSPSRAPVRSRSTPRRIGAGTHALAGADGDGRRGRDQPAHPGPLGRGGAEHDLANPPGVVSRVPLPGRRLVRSGGHRSTSERGSGPVTEVFETPRAGHTAKALGGASPIPIRYFVGGRPSGALRAAIGTPSLPAAACSWPRLSVRALQSPSSRRAAPAKAGR